jgi:MoaA/NifB/PqqE/SkfB family radical SAM enzyme
MIRTRYDKKHHFKEVFNTDTGFSYRTSILDENGEETDEDPFMASFPNLLDIGIMGSCNTGLNGKCKIKCYQSGASRSEANMTLEDYKNIIDQANTGGTFSVALGGRGDPNKHPDFERMLRYTRRNNIVPNYTTSGYELTDREIEITGKYCGAVAVSWHGQKYTEEAIKNFISEGVKTNIHYVLSTQSINKAINILEMEDVEPGLNAIIFLLYKNVGANRDPWNVLTPDDPRVKRFFELVDKGSYNFKIGLDSCSVPGIFNFTKNINPESISGCEAATFSAFISSDMNMMPCSFLQESEHYNIDLRKYSLQQAWDSYPFELFREQLKGSCSGCEFNCDCSPCPIVPEITLCDRKEMKI